MISNLMATSILICVVVFGLNLASLVFNPQPYKIRDIVIGLTFLWGVFGGSILFLIWMFKIIWAN